MFRDVISLMSSRTRKETMLGLSIAYIMVQLSSLPVALSLPTLSKYFNVSIEDTAWVVIIYLLTLGGLVMVSARLGDRYGHNKIFFIGIVISTIGAVLITLSQELWQIVLFRGMTGIGSALILGNSNAILAANFSPEERGRAFAIPIISARFGTLVGLAAFSLFLNYLDWRYVFLFFVPLGVLSLLVTYPMLRHTSRPANVERGGSIDWTGAVLLLTAAVVLVLSGTHLHGGEDSFVSSDGLEYHLPMHGLFLILVLAFVVMEIKVRNPLVPMRHFRHVSFSTSLGSNASFHGSMLAVMTLVPILIERGYGLPPVYVFLVLLPNQSIGLFMPLIAGWIWDKYQPRLLRPAMMVMIASGFLLLWLFTEIAPVWAIPILLLPISIGSNTFNSMNNAAIMNSLPLEDRGVASGMLETSRELGHALGAIGAASALALALPAGIELLSGDLAQIHFVKGFEVSSLVVVYTVLVGAVLAYFHKSPAKKSRTGKATG